MNILAIILYIFGGYDDECIHHKMVVILYIFEGYNDGYIHHNFGASTISI